MRIDCFLEYGIQSDEVVRDFDSSFRENHKKSYINLPEGCVLSFFQNFWGKSNWVSGYFDLSFIVISTQIKIEFLGIHLEF